MRLGLIPPNLYARDMLRTRMSLVLPWQVTDLPKDFIQEVRHDNDRFVILDNGAAEGATVGYQKLLNLAETLRPDIIVVPDRLGDTDWSITTAREASHMTRHTNALLMAVAQGKRLEDVMKSVYAYAGMDHISWIALPRVLNFYFGPTSRLRFAEAFASDPLLQDIPIHCLGASYGFPQEIIELAKLPNVMSMDSSVPYVMAAYGVRLQRRDKYLSFASAKRPDDYFNLTFTPEQEKVKEHNVRTFISWAEAS